MQRSFLRFGRSNRGSHLADAANNVVDLDKRRDNFLRFGKRNSAEVEDVEDCETFGYLVICKSQNSNLRIKRGGKDFLRFG